MMRSGNRSRTRNESLRSLHKRRLLSESEEYQEELDIEELNYHYEDEKQLQSMYATRNASKRPLMLLLDDEEGDEEDAEEDEPLDDVAGEVEEDIDDVELNSKNECIRQINAEHPEPKYDRKPKESRFIWSPQATHMLLDLWKASRLDLVNMNIKNQIIYKGFAEKLKPYGPRYLEIKSKMDNMSRKYRVEAEKVRQTGQPSNWEYFHKIQACLIGTNNVDVFEEIMFENPINDDSSHLDDSEINDEIKSEKSPEIEPPEPDPEIAAEDEPKEDEILTNDLTINQENYHANEQLDELGEQTICTAASPSTFKSKRRKMAHRLMRIEEEKLAIEKEKLQIMKETSLELKLFHRDLLRMFKQK